MDSKGTLVAGTVGVILALATARIATAADTTSNTAVDSDAQDGLQLQEVTVSAQRRSESLQTTPVAVTAIGSGELEARQLTSAQNLSASVPSLLIQNVSASPSAVAIQMRGDEELSGGLVTSESPVALYIDDVYQSRLSTANFDLGDIDQIEVLRGPQGTLYGRNSMTGAVKFITRQPDGSTWLNASVGYGTYDEKRVQTSAGAPIVPNLAFAIAGVIDDKHGWQFDDTLQRHVGSRTNQGLRGSLALVDTGPFNAVLRASYYHTYGDAQYLTPVDPITNRPLVSFGDTLSPLHPSADNRETSVSLALSYKLDPALTVKSVTALSSMSDDWNLDFSGGFTPVPGAAITTGFFRQNASREHELTEELQAFGDVLDSKLHYILGLYYFRETASEIITDTFGAGSFGGGFPDAPIDLLPTSFDTSSYSRAVYTQLDYKLTSKLTATAGLRFTHDQKEFNGFIQGAVFVPAYAPETSTNVAATEWTPKAQVNYQFTDDVMSYATVARGYRAGGFNGLAVANPVVFGSPYAPETSWSYEVGTKTEFFDRRARVNAAFYYEKLDNLQQTVVTDAGNTLTQNAAKAHVYGLELEASVIPVKNLNLYSTLALTGDGYDELDPSTSAAQAHATNLPLISRVQAQVGGSWRYEPVWLGGGALIVNADYDYRTSHYVTPDQSAVAHVPSQHYLNGSLAWQSPDKHWMVTAGGRNLTDEHYYYSGLALVPGVIAGKFAADPFTGMLTVKYSY